MMRPALPRRPAGAARPDLHGRLGLSSRASAEEVERARRELLGFLERAPESVRGWAGGEIAAIDDAYARLSAPAAAKAPRRRSALRRLAGSGLTLAVTAGIVVGVYDMGGGQSKATSQPSGTTEQHGLSAAQQARIAQLMSEVKASPRDVSAMIELGDIFFEAHQYRSAGTWMKRAVAVDPGNVKARVPLGAAEFNSGDIAGAKRDWLRVVAANPKNIEALYDLGFLYVSREPPNMADAKRMWDRVIALAPNSSLAKTIATHIKGLEKK